MDSLPKPLTKAWQTSLPSLQLRQGRRSRSSRRLRLILLVRKIRRRHRLKRRFLCHQRVDLEGYALEIWILVESAPVEYAPPGEDTYGADFVKDTLNLTYPGCTGVYLAESGHLVAFYGRKNTTGAGLTVEQGMEACQVIAEIPSWMGRMAKFKVHAVSLQEATDIVNGLKRLERENFRRACLELNSRLLPLKLGQVPSGLSATATPFVPVAASSVAAMGQPWGVGLPPLGGGFDLTRPLYTTNDEGQPQTTLSSVSSRVSSCKWGSRGKHKKRTQEGGTVSDSGASSLPPNVRRGKRPESMLRSPSLSLGVRLLTPRTEWKPSGDGLTLWPVISSTMRTITSCLR